MFDPLSAARAVEACAILNRLAMDAENAIIPFSKCGKSGGGAYDDKIVYLDNPEDGNKLMSKMDVLADILADDLHHDAISTWGEILTRTIGCETTVKVKDFAEDGEPENLAVTVEIQAGDDIIDIIIDGGSWYFS